MPTNSTHAQLHAYLVTAIDEIRSRLDNAGIGHFDFQITVEGRTNKSKIEYQLGDRYSNDSAVTTVVFGGTLSAVIDEYLHRAGWHKQNNPIVISSPTSASGDPDGHSQAEYGGRASR